MENKISVTIEITNHLKSQLESLAKNKNLTLEEAANIALQEFFSNKGSKQTSPNNENQQLRPSQPSQPAHPSVALIKFDADKTVEGNLPPTKNQDSSFCSQPLALVKDTPISAPQATASDEQISRKSQIESQMKELSLLINTADEEAKKQEYSVQYALLASELDSIL